MNFYELLGVAPDASIDEIKIQRNRMLLAYHPDHNKGRSANDMTKQLNVAWETLSDPVKRHEYNEALKSQPSAASSRPERVRTRLKPRQPFRRTSRRVRPDEEDFDGSIFFFPISDVSEVSQRTILYIAPNVTSNPNRINELFELENSQLILSPLYSIHYDVHEDFRTSVGIINSIHVNDDELMLDGATGNLLNQEVYEFLANSATLSRAQAGRSLRMGFQAPFQISAGALRQLAKELISTRHSETVRYHGANNVEYTKTCTPREKNIFLKDVRRVYAPVWEVSVFILSKRYRLRTLEKPGQLLIQETDFSICRICNEAVTGTQEMLLCNACGNIVHRSRSHGYSCHECDKSICRNCVYWARKFVLFKTYLCEACAERYQRRHKITRPLVKKRPKRYCVSCGTKVDLDAIRCMQCRAVQPEDESNRSGTQFNGVGIGLSSEPDNFAHTQGRKWETAKKILKWAVITLGVLLAILAFIGFLGKRGRRRGIPRSRFVRKSR